MSSSSVLRAVREPNRKARRAEASTKHKLKQPLPATSRRYLTSTQLRERYGNRSEMWIDRIMRRDPAFPRPIYIGRYRFWALDEIETYERGAAARRVPEVA